MAAGLARRAVGVVLGTQGVARTALRSTSSPRSSVPGSGGGSDSLRGVTPIAALVAAAALAGALLVAGCVDAGSEDDVAGAADASHGAAVSESDGRTQAGQQDARRVGLPPSTFAGDAFASPTPGWLRVDLWSTPPELLRGRPGAFASVLGRQAADLAPLPSPAGAPPGGAVLTAPRARALRQQASTLQWRLHLGDEPYLAFTPFADTPPCPATATVAMTSPEGKPRILWSQPTPRAPWPAGPEVVVDLGPWAGHDVALQLDVRHGRNAYRSCAMLWGNPEVVSRQLAPLPRRAAAAPPNILLIGADTLRADALGAWGRRPSVTPALDALAAGSDVWLDAYCTVNATNPSFASIHTGLYASHHGVHDLETPLPEGQVTLAERLAAAGYDTAAVFAAQHLNPLRSGLGQGFATVATAEDTSAARLAVDRAIDWLQRPRARPFFLWVHLFDPHTPHLPPAPFALGMRAATPFGLGIVKAWTPFRAVGLRPFREPKLAADRDLYLGEVAYLDREVDRLLGLLDSRGQLADTLVAFVADHGENLEDHGIAYRHAGLWDTTTHVPMMIRWPEPPSRAAGPSPGGRRLHGLVQTIDLYPTLLAAAGLRRQPHRRPRPAYGCSTAAARVGRRSSPSKRMARAPPCAPPSGATSSPPAATWWPTAPISTTKPTTPAELTNLAGKRLGEELELRALLAGWLRGGRVEAPAAHLTPEEAAALRALGYD